MNKKSINVLLLVEDNPGDVRLVREMFHEQGLHNTVMTQVESIGEAEKHLASNTSPDIILLDLGLADTQGLESIRRARAAAPLVPVVVLTSLDDDSMAALALQEGVQDYLIKGQIDARGLFRTMRYAVERKGMEVALFAERELAQVTLNSIGDAIMCTGALGNITFLNPVAERMTGWSREEAAGKPMAEVFRILEATNRKTTPDPMAIAVRLD